jgi:hypothetical protein
MGHTEIMAGLQWQPEALAEPEKTTEDQIGAVPDGCLAVMRDR